MFFISQRVLVTIVFVMYFIWFLVENSVSKVGSYNIFNLVTNTSNYYICNIVMYFIWFLTNGNTNHIKYITILQ